MHNNRETVIIPQTIIVPPKSIIVASGALCLRAVTVLLQAHHSVHGMRISA